MNSAQFHKNDFKRKRTYFVPLIMAACTFVIMFLAGAESEYLHEQEELVKEQPVIPIEDTLQLSKEEMIRFSDIPYTAYFKQYAPNVNWPWELLASVAYHESRFKPQTVSRFGARGVMQLMPTLCEKYGLDDSTSFVPKYNIEASTKLIATLQKRYEMVTDSAEQIKFILASYNTGSAHILDAQRLAEKYGDNPCFWEDTEYYLENLNQPEFYTDSVVLYGSFRAKTTIRYVHNVLHTYHQIKAAHRPENTEVSNLPEHTEVPGLPE